MYICCVISFGKLFELFKNLKNLKEKVLDKLFHYDQSTFVNALTCFWNLVKKKIVNFYYVYNRNQVPLVDSLMCMETWKSLLNWFKSKSQILILFTDRGI